MLLNVNSIQTNILYYKDKILSSLTAQQKKILIVAAVALSCIAAVFLYCRCCFKGSAQIPQDDSKADQTAGIKQPEASKVADETEVLTEDPKEEIAAHIPKELRQKPAQEQKKASDPDIKTHVENKEAKEEGSQPDAEAQQLKDFQAVRETPFEEKQDHFLKAIQCQPNDAVAYKKLADLLPQGGKITLLDGTVMTKQDLYLKAIQLIWLQAQLDLAVTFNDLADSLPQGGKITLLDGTEMSKQDLYLKAIQLQPDLAVAYKNLADSLPLGGKIELLDGTEITKQDLYLKAIQLQPDFAVAYFELANLLPQGGKIELLDGTKMTEQDLCLKAIQLNPDLAVAYNHLGGMLPLGGKITLLDGTEMTEQDLFLKAIHLMPDLAVAYHSLAVTLPQGGKIKLLDGTEMTKQDLYLKVIQLQPDLAVVYNASCIHSASRRQDQTARWHRDDRARSLPQSHSA